MGGDILAQGVELMIYGMGTVVVFLAMLVVMTTVMSRTIARYFPQQEPSVSDALMNLRTATHPAEDPNLVAVISAAVHQFRRTRK